MEQVKLAMIADLMSKQSGEDVDAGRIIAIPENKAHNDMSPDRYDAYVARTDNYTCLAHFYADGRVHVHVH